MGTADASGEGMGGGAFVNTQLGVDSILWRSRFPAHIQRSFVTFKNPNGTVTNSDLELAATIAHHNIVAHHHDVRKQTIHLAHDNTTAMFWQGKGSASTSGPSKYLLRMQL